MSSLPAEKTALSARTNCIIGRSAPSIYLAKLEAKSNLDREQMTALLETHRIASDELYGDDFEKFFALRGSALVELTEQATGKPVPREGADFLAEPQENEYEDEEDEWNDEDDSGEFDSLENAEGETEIGAADMAEESPEQNTDAAQLQQQFHEAMIAIYKTASRNIGYKPTYFLQMVTELGGLEAARHLLQTSELPEEFTTLWVNG